MQLRINKLSSYFYTKKFLTPGFTGTDVFAPRLMVLFLVFSRFFPLHPSDPPFIPYGENARRSDKTDKVIFLRNITSRRTPSPPLNFPTPPVPLSKLKC